MDWYNGGMPKQTTTPLQQFLSSLGKNKKRSTVTITVIAILILGVASWAWWSKVFTSTHKVYWDTIDQSLTTTSYSKTIKSETRSQKLSQTVRLQFVNHLRAFTTTKLESPGRKVTTETIGTPKGGFARYQFIDSKPVTDDKSVKPRDYSKIVGVWSKMDPTTEGQVNTRMIDEAIFGPILLGSLQYPARSNLVSDLQSSKAYTVEYDKVKKEWNGIHPVYTFNVTLSPKSFIKSVAEFYEAVGLDGSQFDVSQYSDENKIKMAISIDVLSRTVRSIKYLDGSQREEAYSDYGVRQPISIPTKTIPTSELQKRLQKIEQ